MSVARRVRQAAVFMHRWTGVSLAAFLLVLAVTGAVLPFKVELERLFAPERFLSARQASCDIDWLHLREVAEKRSGGLITLMPLSLEGGAAPVYNPESRLDSPGLAFDELVLDPCTGKEIAWGHEADLREGRAQILPFIFRLHSNLAIGRLGETLLGIVALAWTIDCFVGLYLTVPHGSTFASQWRRWRIAWAIRWPSPSRARLHFDAHRALSLWLWVLLFVFAWSGVAFNLPHLYAAMMSKVTDYVSADPTSSTPPAERRHLSWSEALTAARRAASSVAAEQGLQILRERELRYQESWGRYAYAFRSTRDKSDSDANSWLSIDASSGAVLSVELPTGEHTGNTIEYWLGLIHVAEVGGIAGKILVSACALVTALVTITGLLIWARKVHWKLDRANVT